MERKGRGGQTEEGWRAGERQRRGKQEGEEGEREEKQGWIERGRKEG
jgi:hypothetical protein